MIRATVIMDRLAIILTLAFLAGIGYLKISSKIAQEKMKSELASEFQWKLFEFVDSRGRNNEAYTWLLQNSYRMQEILGAFGIMSSLRVPFSNYVYKNYPVILNFIPQVRESFQQLSPTNDHGIMIAECLERFMGYEAHLIDTLQKEKHNPVIWIRDGVQWILGFPILLLKSLGLLNPRGYKVANSLVQVFSGLVTLIGLISSVMGIVLGFSDFMNLLNK